MWCSCYDKKIVYMIIQDSNIVRKTVCNEAAEGAILSSSFSPFKTIFHALTTLKGIEK